MTNTPKTLADYKRLPYTLRTEPVTESDGTTYWIAQYVELSGCKIDGETEVQAVANLYELFDDYISTMIENNQSIPVPRIHYPQVWPITLTTTLQIHQSKSVSGIREGTRSYSEYGEVVPSP
jgi:predicted RNase H-like HicB family nuclease